MTNPKLDKLAESLEVDLRYIDRPRWVKRIREVLGEAYNLGGIAAMYGETFTIMSGKPGHRIVKDVDGFRYEPVDTEEK